MKATSAWITYRTRFLVKAKQLNTSLTFTDMLGRVHSGRKGDYLVESSDGVLRIAPRQIFEDIYVPLICLPTHSETTARESLPHRSGETSTSNAVNLQPIRPATRASKRQNFFDTSIVPCLTRKSPQPERRRRNPMPGARSL